MSLMENQIKYEQIKTEIFLNKSMKSWREKKKEIEMYSTHNEGKSVVAERYIRILI